MGRRGSIEPRIGHLKAHFRLGRTFLKGIFGDMANGIPAASAMNLLNWMSRFLLPLFQMLRWSHRMLEKLRGWMAWGMPKFVEAFSGPATYATGVSMGSRVASDSYRFPRISVRV